MAGGCFDFDFALDLVTFEAELSGFEAFEETFPFDDAFVVPRFGAIVKEALAGQLGGGKLGRYRLAWARFLA